MEAFDANEYVQINNGDTAQCSYRLTRGAAPIFVRPLRRSQKYLFYVKTLNQTSYQDYCGARAGQHIKANFNPRHLKCIK